ncbi:MAG: 2OG-Fe(II) oxygenase [Alphaproteobacteria bacterium]|nr:2OG-Fe(II) oxygenase [Alphaproteobacteria bacterium]
MMRLPESAAEAREPQTRLTIGDIVPPFSLQKPDGAAFEIGGDEAAGHFRVLVFTGAVQPTQAVNDALGRRLADMRKHDALVFRVQAQPEGSGSTNIPVLIDQGRRVAEAFRPDGAPIDAPLIVALCPNQHLLAVASDAGRELDALVSAIGREARHYRASEGERHAPILQMPRVLSPDDCRYLINKFTIEGNTFIEPGHGNQNLTHDYKMKIPEYGRNDRIDHWVMNPATVRFIDERLKRRLLPEVRKAFAYRITKHENYRITKYEGARGGELHGHRDDSEPRVAHRRFALSINLNSEEFEGGGIRFPEYGGQVYRPASGAALLFSCSILHEALHVTKGRRFVLLGFMFGET